MRGGDEEKKIEIHIHSFQISFYAHFQDYTTSYSVPSKMSVCKMPRTMHSVPIQRPVSKGL